MPNNGDPGNVSHSGASIPPKKCGIIMPISDLDGCDEAHWLEVREVIKSAAKRADFEAELVSTTNSTIIIQKAIIQNLFLNTVVVCDVSGKNPNVMFELGMRLAFNKPAIVIKDEATTYSFDTSGIVHLSYPRDLNYFKIQDFIDELSTKIKESHKAGSFLTGYGEFLVPAKLDTKEADSSELVLQAIKDLSAQFTTASAPSRGISGDISYPGQSFAIALHSLRGLKVQRSDNFHEEQYKALCLRLCQRLPGLTEETISALAKDAIRYEASIGPPPMY